MHGNFKGTVEHTADGLLVNGKAVKGFTKMNVRRRSSLSGCAPRQPRAGMGPEAPPPSAGALRNRVH